MTDGHPCDYCGAWAHQPVVFLSPQWWAAWQVGSLVDDADGPVAYGHACSVEHARLAQARERLAQAGPR